MDDPTNVNGYYQMPSDSSATEVMYDIPQNSIKSEPDQCFSEQEIQGVPQDQSVAHNPAHAIEYSQVPQDSYISEQVTCTSQAQNLNTWQNTQQGDFQNEIQGVPQDQSTVSNNLPVRLYLQIPCNVPAGQVTGDMHNNDTKNSGSGDIERSRPGKIRFNRLRTGQQSSVRKMISCYRCKYCDQYMHDRQYFKMHILRHEKKYRKFWVRSRNLVQNTTSSEIMWIPSLIKIVRIQQGIKSEECYKVINVNIAHNDIPGGTDLERGYGYVPRS